MSLFFGSQKWRPAAVSVVSVYPEQKHEKRKHQGYATYEMPACESDKIKIAEPHYTHPANEEQSQPHDMEIRDCPPGEGYSLLRVYDTAQRCFDPVAEQYIDRPIPVEVVATDLVRTFGEEGFGVVEDGEPTSAQLDEVRKQLHTKFVRDVQIANDWDRKGEGIRIRHRHRLAARHLGDESYSWVKEIQHRVVKECVACAKPILAKAIVCEHCGTNLVKFYSDMRIEPVRSEDPAVYDFFMSRKAAAASKSKPKSAAEIKAEVALKLDRIAAEKRQSVTPVSANG